MNEPVSERTSPPRLFLLFLRLGCIAFGGPVAHLALFRQEFVERRRWLGEERFAELIAFCQFLPGPASSQVGMALGLRRGGLAGMFAAWLGFTLPAAAILVALAVGLAVAGDAIPAGVLRGLHAAVVAVVAWAVWSMAAKLCPDRTRATFALVAATIMVVLPSPWMQLVVIGVGAFAGAALVRPAAAHADADAPHGRPRAALVALGVAALAIGAGLVLAGLFPGRAWAVLAVFARAGSLVFGGGHVVLPMLEVEVVGRGWLEHDAFLTGYGLTQAMPGPIFTFSAWCGAAMATGWNAILLASVAVIGIFAPSFLMVPGLLPLWEHLRRIARLRAALAGVAAAVVGLLLAALYDPILTAVLAVDDPAADLAVALASFCLLAIWRVPAWAVVAIAALAGWALITA